MATKSVADVSFSTIEIEAPADAPNPKKRKRAEPTTKRATKAEKADAVSFHNAHLLALVGSFLCLSAASESDVMAALALSVVEMNALAQSEKALDPDADVETFQTGLNSLWKSFSNRISIITQPKQSDTLPPPDCVRRVEGLLLNDSPVDLRDGVAVRSYRVSGGFLNAYGEIEAVCRSVSKCRAGCANRRQFAADTVESFELYPHRI